MIFFTVLTFKDNYLSSFLLSEFSIKLLLKNSTLIIGECALTINTNKPFPVAEF